MLNIIRGDSFEVLADLELDDPVSTVVTSPPYLAQRRYGDDPRELGLEHSVDDFVERIVVLGKLLRPYLADGASWWLNLGGLPEPEELLQDDPVSPDDREAFDDVLRRADEIAERLAAELELPEGLEIVFDRTPLLEHAGADPELEEEA